MKKRYIATPVLLIGVAATWNFVLRPDTPIASAEEIKEYTAPEVGDLRHPVDVFQMNTTQGETEGDIIKNLPTVVYPEDKVSFVVDPKWGLGTIVHVERAMPITVKDGRRTFAVRTWSNTVEEVLDDINRELGDLDRANYKSSARLEPNMIIEITRVAKVNITTKEVVTFETVEKDDPTEYRGVTRVTQEGKNGERTKVYEITREDGEEISRRLVSNEVTTKPVNKVISKGTKLKIGKTVSGSASWYNLCCTKVASTSFKKGTVLRLTNLTTGKQIEVKVDDTGAFGPEHGNNRVVDLHPDHFRALGGTLGQGIMQNIRAEEILNP